MDREHFSREVTKHHRQLIAYAISLTSSDPHRARDLVQEALVTAYKNLTKFDVSRDFGSWVRGIIRNHWRDELRKKRPVPLEHDELEALEEEHQRWDEFADSGSDLFEQLGDCIASLPDNFRAAVQQIYFVGDSGREAAEALATSESALRKRLQRAREQLRNCLQEHTPNPTA